MKSCKRILRGLLGGVLLGIVFSACGSDEEAKLVNTQTINMKTISKIVLDYDADDLVIKNSKSQKIILEEYLSRDKRKYYSKVSKKGKTLTLNEGKRPLGSSFKSKMVLSIPQEYTNKLQVHSTSGKIESELSNKTLAAVSLDTTSGKITSDNLTADRITLTTTSGMIEGKLLQSEEKLQIKSTSGIIKLKSLKADRIRLQTTSSKAVLETVKGEVNYETKSGNLSLSNFSGGGEFLANGDGSIKVTVKKLSDDLSAFSKNGPITLVLSKLQKARFTLKSKEGKIQNQRKEFVDENDSSIPQVKLETRNGDIRVK